jgi:hypothetical protein
LSRAKEVSAERTKRASVQCAALKGEEDGVPRWNSDSEDPNEPGALVGEDVVPVSRAPDIAMWPKNVWAVFEVKKLLDLINDAFHRRGESHPDRNPEQITGDPFKHRPPASRLSDERFRRHGRVDFGESCNGNERHVSHPAHRPYDSTPRCVYRVEQP